MVSASRFCVSIVRFIAEYFLGAVINGIVFLILVSTCSLLVCGNPVDFCLLTLYLIMQLKQYLEGNL